MVKLLCAVLLCSAFSTVKAQDISTWKATYPDAASGIIYWVKADRAAAYGIADWDSAYSDHSKAFTTWFRANRGHDVSEFISLHTDWTELSGVLNKDWNSTRVYEKISSGFNTAMDNLMATQGGLKIAVVNLK